LTGIPQLDITYAAIYGYHMTDTTKTTVYLDADDYRRLKAIARAEGKTTAEVVREAVAAYARAARGTAVPASVGAGRSGRTDLSERAEDLLAGLGEGER
jgi:predicted transcriptional regulator